MGYELNQWQTLIWPFSFFMVYLFFILVSCEDGFNDVTPNNQSTSDDVWLRWAHSFNGSETRGLGLRNGKSVAPVKLLLSVIRSPREAFLKLPAMGTLVKLKASHFTDARVHHNPIVLWSRRRLFRIRFSVRSSSNGIQEKGNYANYRGLKPKLDLVADLVSNNENAVRRLPIFVGGFSLLAVLVNRTISGVSAVADASSSQSRTDILTLGLAITNLLTGLVWLSIQPKNVSAVTPQGVWCRRVCSGVPDNVITELLWVWDSLSAVTCCRSLVIVYGNNCLLQIGIAAESSTNLGIAVAVDVTKLIQGLVYQGVMKSGKQSYWANLSLYPGRSELLFLPSNTQAVILQPLGSKGIAIIGGDTIRGFSILDQAWITSIAEKLDVTFSKVENSFTSVAQNK